MVGFAYQARKEREKGMLEVKTIGKTRGQKGIARRSVDNADSKRRKRAAALQKLQPYLKEARGGF